MTSEEALRIARRRLLAQHLAGPPLAGPEHVVGWLGALQSQEYDLAKWSLGQRADGVADGTVERAVAEGTILRTHVLRPTWHFVLPADIRWMLELTAPRVGVQAGHSYRRLGLDDDVFRKSNSRIKRALRGGNQLIRKELRAVLERAGIEVDALRLSMILLNAELTGLICSGAPQGKLQSYALLAERAPEARVLSRDDALAELTLRYFTSHGPATVKDFRWWSSLPIADIKRGLEAVGPRLEREEVGAVPFWSGGPRSVPKMPSPSVDLLQPFDEYVVAYKESRDVIDAADLVRSHEDRSEFSGAVLCDGQITGHWKRTFDKDRVLVEVSLYAPLDGPQTDALHLAAAEYGEFVGRPVSVRKI